MLVLDTNVASELMRPEPTPGVAAWISGRDAEDLYLTAVSEAELLYGVAIMPTGRRRNALEAAMSRWLDLGFADRILPFDSSAARAYAVIASSRRHACRPIGEADCQITAISRSQGAVLVTRNVRDFEDTGVDVVDWPLDNHADIVPRPMGHAPPPCGPPMVNGKDSSTCTGFGTQTGIPNHTSADPSNE